METENRSTPLTSQIQALRSSNKQAILGALKEIRSKGSVSILPELFQVLLVQEDEQILEEITHLLNDLKDKEAAEILALAIADPQFAPIQHILVGACWQNGLSYGKYIEVFAEVLLSADYQAALEAFTVLEEALGEVDSETRKRVSERLSSKLKEVDDPKKPLVSAMVNTLKAH